MKDKIKRIFIICLVCCSSILTQGCVDVFEVFTINRDGSGIVTVHISGDPSFVTLEMLGGIAPWINGRNISRERTYYQGKPTRIEKLSFNRLSEITDRASGYIQYGPNGNGTSTLKSLMRGASTPDPDIESGAWMFAGNYYTFSVRVPGSIIKAHPVYIDGSHYYPDQSGNKITWTVPINRLATYQNNGNDIEYRVDYSS